MNRYKIFFLAVVIFTSLIFASVSAAQKQSRLIQHDLKYGISVKIPKHWEIVDKKIMDQIDTNTELLTKVPQGDNEIIIAANYTAKNQTLATIRISVRTRNTFTQDAIKKMSQTEIEKQDISGRAMTMNALAKMNNTFTKVSEFKTSKEVLSGFVCMKTDYQITEPPQTMNTSIYVIYQGTRAVKMTISYDDKYKKLLETTIDEIINSLIIK